MTLIMGSNASIIDVSKPWSDYTQCEQAELLANEVPMAHHIVHNCPGRSSDWIPPIKEADSTELCPMDNLQRMLNDLDVEATALLPEQDTFATAAAFADMLNDPSFERAMLRI